jgi:hypothetical protein
MAFTGTSTHGGQRERQPSSPGSGATTIVTERRGASRPLVIGPSCRVGWRFKIGCGGPACTRGHSTAGLSFFPAPPKAQSAHDWGHVTPSRVGCLFSWSALSLPRIPGLNVNLIQYFLMGKLRPATPSLCLRRRSVMDITSGPHVAGTQV